MVEINEKLSQGVKVDPDVVSNLLLNGIINIIDQNECLDELEQRIKLLEHSDITNKARIESLESWVLKQGDSINNLDEKLESMDKTGAVNKESKDIVELKMKMSQLEQQVKLPSSKNTVLKAEKERVFKAVKCKECGDIFSKNFELEKHMVNIHKCEKNYSCEHCDKAFYLDWRLKKHVSVHDEDVKRCKFVMSGQECPYDDVGCMFSHEPESEEIINDIIENIETDESDSDEPLEEDNFCYYCNSNFGNQSDLVIHMSENHMDRFNAFQQDNLIQF